MLLSHLWTGPEGDPATSREVDTAFEAVAHGVRRTVLTHLAAQDSPVAADALAETVAKRHDGLSARDARITLRHVHLPKLADGGYVADDDPVELTNRADFPLAVLAVED